MESANKKSATASKEEERYPIPGPEREPVDDCPAPFNLQKFIDENKDQLKPPIGVKLVYDQSEDYIIFIVGGPNKRSDYHINKSEEYFHQIKGDMVLKVVMGGFFKDIHIREGEIFLLPANIPHSPQRFPDTIGLVLERRRTAELVDHVRWYCDQCKEIVHEEKLALKTLKIGAALTPVVNNFYEKEELRTCKKCGHISQIPK